MATGREIRAGKAIVEIAAEDDQLKRDLVAAAGTLKGWGTALSTVGASVAAAWAAIAGSQVVGMLANTVRSLVEFGGELSDMSARTGMAASQLQFLMYAAKQTGTSIEAVDAAVRAMVRNGLNSADFEKVGRGIAAITDPSERAKAAMENFGKSGTQLLPLFAQWAELRAQSDRLGPILSDRDVENVDALGDAFGSLQEAIKRASNSLAVDFNGELMGATQFGLGFVLSLARGLDEVSAKLRGIKVDSDAADSLNAFFTQFQEIGQRALEGTRDVRKANTDAAMREADAQERISKEAENTKNALLRGVQARAETFRRQNSERESLIGEFETPAEAFLKKLKQITSAIEVLKKQFDDGLISDAQFADDMKALEEAGRRANRAEAARMGKEFERLGKATRGVTTFSKGSTTAAGAALLGRSAEAMKDELRVAKESEKHLASIDRKIDRLGARFT